MDLSIIIISYNTKELLKQCLGSVVGCLVIGDSEKKLAITQPLTPNTEIIVVDNGSTDGSAELVQSSKCNPSTSLGTRVQSDSLKLKVIENKENIGFAKAVNQGIKEAEGEAILLLNSDTQVKPDALEQLLKFEEKVRPAIIGARLLNPDGSVQASVFHLPTIKRAVLEYWLRRKGEFSKYAPGGDEPVGVEAVVGGAMLISREVIEKIGLFDERYFMYFEDLDYCRRARKTGFKIWYLPTAEIIHEHGASGKELVGEEDQWKRLIPSSKIYHGFWKHHFINLIIWLGQKLKKQ